MIFQSRLEARRAEADPAYLDAISLAARQLDRAGVPRRCLRRGEAAPDFALATPGGRVVALSDRLRNGPVVISFFRGEWCPFCRTEIEALVETAPAMARLGATLLLVSPEPASRRLAGAVAASGEHVALLRDPMLGVALLYGLAYLVPDPLRRFYLGRDTDLSRDLSTGSWMLPIPADYIVGRDGRVALAYAETDFTRRLDPALIIEDLDGSDA